MLNKVLLWIFIWLFKTWKKGFPLSEIHYESVFLVAKEHYAVLLKHVDYNPSVAMPFAVVRGRVKSMCTCVKCPSGGKAISFGRAMLLH